MWFSDLACHEVGYSYAFERGKTMTTRYPGPLSSGSQLVWGGEVRPLDARFHPFVGSSRDDEKVNLAC